MASLSKSPVDLYATARTRSMSVKECYVLSRVYPRHRLPHMYTTIAITVKMREGPLYLDARIR